MDNYRAWIEGFVSLFLASGYRREVIFTLTEEGAAAARESPILESPLAPAEMLAGEINHEGFAPWRPVPSPIDDDLLDGFERFLQAPLPRIFRAYLSHLSLMSVNLYLGALPNIDPRYPLSWLEWVALRRRKPLYRARPWLIPFTDGPVSSAALCFDTRRPDQQGDYPIIRIPWRYVNEVSAFDSVESKYEVFPSCMAFFDFLREWLTYQTTGLRWEELPFPSWLEQRGKSEPPETYHEEE